MSTSSPSQIVEIKVEKLFGKYDYTLRSPISESSLILLYGDNGSGKTTIMNLLFHALSSANNRGHRGALAKIPFKSLTVNFTGNNYVHIEKKNPEDKDGFKYEIVLDGTSEGMFFPISSEHRDKKSWQRVLSLLRKFNLTPFFLTDDRKLISDTLPDRDTETSYTLDGLVFYSNNDDRATRRRSDSTISAAFIQTLDWLRKQLLSATGEGEVSAQALFSETVARLVAANSDDQRLTSDQMIANFEKLLTKSSEYSRFGLTTQLDLEKIINQLRGISSQSVPTISIVVAPYLDSLNARYNALSNLYEVLSLFESHINSYLLDKEIKIDASSGIKIYDANKIEIDPNQLSSGEKHLLLIFCTTLTARNSNAVFFIDEPEISLNIKWQRTLVNALLSIAKGSQVQFLMATHSIELLSQHSENVVSLTNSTSST